MITNYYLGHDGQRLIEDKDCSFSKNFDWICCKNRIIKHKDIPNTIYCKLDFLRYWYRTDIKHLDSRFILITGASDYSPSINYFTVYKMIVDNPNLIVWFAENNVLYNPKVMNISVGLATHKWEIERTINCIKKINIQPNNRINKIYCRWRGNRASNCLGSGFVERPSATKWAVNNSLCLYENDEQSQRDYLIKVKQHKYLLCPLGNGSDSSPKLAEAIIMGTVPIVKKTYNNYNLYKSLPVLFINNWEDITQDLLNSKGEELFKQLQDKDYSYYFTADYWTNLIKSYI